MGLFEYFIITIISVISICGGFMFFINNKLSRFIETKSFQETIKRFEGVLSSLKDGQDKLKTKLESDIAKLEAGQSKLEAGQTKGQSKLESDIAKLKLEQKENQHKLKEDIINEIGNSILSLSEKNKKNKP